MSMQDPIGDFLTRIRNALIAKQDEVLIPSSKHKVEITKILKAEGYIHDFVIEEKGKKPILKILLKYFDGNSAISRLRRVSKPGCRVYSRSRLLPKVAGGLGVVIVSTPEGVITGKQATLKKLGGEVICEIF